MIILILDTVELLRRAAGKPEVTLDIVLSMGLLKLPVVGQQILPFVILFSAMFTFWRLTRSHELVVTRASGVSAWQFLAPILVAACLLGCMRIAIINPIGARLIAEFDLLEQRYLKRQVSAFEISRYGLWLRQTDEHATYLMHAASITPLSFDLIDVTIYRFATGNDYEIRIDADTALLQEGRWLIRDAVSRTLNRPPERIDKIEIPTELTPAEIAESFARPETISFWGLPQFIDTLEAAGISAIRHRLHFQSLLAQPLLFCAMVLFAAAFSLRQTRRGGTLLMISGGVGTGFTLFVLTDVVLSLGATESIPVLMAAWAPALVSLLLGTAALFYLEDG